MFPGSYFLLGSTNAVQDWYKNPTALGFLYWHTGTVHIAENSDKY